MKTAYRRFLFVDDAVGQWFGGVLWRFWSLWVVLTVASWASMAFERGQQYDNHLVGRILWTMVLLYLYQPRRIYRMRKYRCGPDARSVRAPSARR